MSPAGTSYSPSGNELWLHPAGLSFVFPTLVGIRDLVMVGPADSFCINPCGINFYIRSLGTPYFNFPLGDASNHWLAFRVISEIIPAGLFCISDPQALLILIPLRGMLQIIGWPFGDHLLLFQHCLVLVIWSMVGPAGGFCINPAGLILISDPGALLISIP